MIVTIVLIVLAVGAFFGFIMQISMTPEEHREAAYNESLQSAREHRPRWVTAHNERAEAHLRVADEKERRLR